MAGGKLYGYNVFAKSQFFPTARGINFYLTIMVVETLRRYNPTQSQIKVIINPTILIMSDEIHVITQVLDTQELSITGDTANHD